MGIGKRNTPERLRKAYHHFVYSDLLDFEKDDTDIGSDELDLDQLLLRAFNEESQQG